MKKLLLICIGLSFTAFGFSQSFEVKSVGTKYSGTDLNAAIESADLCGYHYISERRVLTFDDGSTVELFSGLEIPSFDSNCATSKQTEHVDQIWGVDSKQRIFRSINFKNAKQ